MTHVGIIALLVLLPLGFCAAAEIPRCSPLEDYGDGSIPECSFANISSPVTLSEWRLRECSIGFGGDSIARCSFRAKGGASPGAEYTPPEAKLRDWGAAGWQPRNTGLALVQFGLRWYDAKQTRACQSASPYCREVGPIARAMYGERPNANEVYKFQSRMLALEQFIAYQLNSPLREVWQVGVMLTPLSAIRHNRKVIAGMQDYGIAIEQPDATWPIAIVGIGLFLVF